MNGDAKIVFPTFPVSARIFPLLMVAGLMIFLAQLGVTSNDVKRWAVTQGLLDTVKRGRIRVELVELYAATHRRDATA